METKFNFNSAICTSRSQSERLLSLGLKKETADMMHYAYLYPVGGDIFKGEYHIRTKRDNVWEEIGNEHRIPAWSLDRLLCMLPDNAPKIFWILDGASITIEFEDDDSNFFPHKGDIYEGVVNCIEWLIKEGYFNKEYLCQK